MNATPKTPQVILVRRTHILVYAHDVMRSKTGFEALKNILQLRNTDVFNASWVTFTAMLEDKDPNGRKILRLPLNVPDETLLAAWPAHRIVIDNRSWPRREVRTQFHSREYPFRNEDQARIVDYLLGKREFSSIIYGESRLVSASTAVGKSYCTIRAWVERGDVLLGTFAQSAHMMNFHAELLKFTTLEETDILVVDDGNNTVRKMLKDTERLRSYKVILVLHRTIWNSINKEITDGEVVRQSEIIRMLLEAEVGTHISDEAHFELSSLVYLALLTNIDQTFYLTATPKRTDWREDRLLGLQLPRQNALVIKTETRLDVIQMTFTTGANESDVARCRNRQGYFDASFYAEYLSRPKNWPYVSEVLTDTVERCFTEGNASAVGIVVSGKLEFLDKVVDLMKEVFPDRSVGNFSSRVKMGAAREAELDKDIVVTTDKSFNGSVNPKRMSHLIFIAPIVSDVVIEQISGRLRGIDGNPCVFIDIWDSSFPALNDQSRLRKRTFKRLAKSVSSSKYPLKFK